jgi:hypothetical protein
VTSLSKVRRRRTALMLLINVVVLGLVGGLLYAGAKALSHYEGARNTAKPTIKVPDTPVGMLATVDGSNRLTSIALFVMKPAPAVGGSIVVVPVSSDTSGGVGARLSLADTYKSGGAQALGVALESTMGITLTATDLATPEQLQAMLRPLKTISVTLPKEVRTTKDGAVVSVAPAGAAKMTPFEWTSALNARVDTENDRDRRSTIDALWGGVANSIASGAVQVNSSLAPKSFDLILNMVVAGPTAARGLPAKRILGTTVPKGADVEELDRPEAVLVMASIAPSAMSAPNPGLVYRLESPPGTEAKVKYAISVILYLGGNVHSVYMNGPTQEATLMYMYDQRFAEQTLNSLKVFGKVQSVPPDQRIDGVDVVLQLGTSFLNGNQNGAMPTTTSTTIG